MPEISQTYIDGLLDRGWKIKKILEDDRVLRDLYSLSPRLGERVSGLLGYIAALAEEMNG